MGKKNKKNKKKFREDTTSKLSNLFTLPAEAKKWIWGVVIFILAVIVVLSFFELAGVAGRAVMTALVFLLGDAVFAVPVILVLAAVVFFWTKYDRFLGPTILAIMILIIGVSSLLETLGPAVREGGWVGYIFSWPFLRFFEYLVTRIIFSGIILVGGLIFWHLLRPSIKIFEKKKPAEEEEKSLANQLFRKIIEAPQFKVREVEPRVKEEPSKIEEPVFDLKSKELSRRSTKALLDEYKFPPIDLLETDKGRPTAGDTVTSSAIIKKTLENFGVGVEMSEINIGPTVTQYTLKPAEGVKLSKITTLSNNLSLALASHPIRIEAPIPGKALVGIEVPNKERCSVHLRDLISNPNFQKTASSLTSVLGRDVSGNPCYADLSKMPHLLVAGATGTGKTIFLNSLILSLLYQNSPETLRLILIDPKRVEFSHYWGIPHLLAPVIFDAQKAVNAFKWLVSEMERRFGVLSQNGSRDIASYNDKAMKSGEENLPYIILIVDELADLMAARGRDVEGGIVRLAQMARAVGIHLILATQRPSVEVITGLIKANVTSRITFQVASQVDSRTVLDSAGAEKLLGLGDMLFVSADVVKPKRIQGPYVSEKEVKKVVDWIKSNAKTDNPELEEGILENHLALDLEKSLEAEEGGYGGYEGGGGDDSLYEEAKRIVIESKKASASLLQRRLRVGYARAARLLDILEQKGVVGPGEGAKPREVFFSEPREESVPETEPKTEFEDDEWQQV